MSRIGNKPIELPSGVEISVDKNNVVKVKGSKGELTETFDKDIKITVEESQIVVERPTNQPRHRALHGLVRSLIANMVTGVTEGFKVELEIVGVGYRFVQKGKDVDVSAGFSHPVVVSPPEGVEFKVESTNALTISGINKQVVGQIAAEIRKKRPPEPYKGKGIKYKGEYIRRKIGKRAT